MAVLNKLIKANLLKNKQRTVVSIIGIILSCALITALFGLVSSFQEALIQDSIETYGHRHVTFFDVPSDEVEDVINHKEVSSYYLSNMKVAKDDDVYIGINGIDKNGLIDLKNQVNEGDVPTSENEIVIDESYASKKDIEIGDEITITTGERYSDGYLLTDHNPVIKDENGVMQEVFEKEKSKTYKVVGISGIYSFLRSEYIYNCYTFEENIKSSADIHILYETPKNYDKITASINGTKTDTENGKYDFDYNVEYLRWSGYAVSDLTKNVLYTMAGIISFIIVISSVFCIRNSFAISVAEKTKLFGMLSSVGATPKQIKRSVLKEGFYLGIVGIPIGLLSGVLACFVLIKITSYLIGGMGSMFSFIFKISWVSILFAIVLSVLTIYLSAISSAKRASKITEIEAIKNQKEIKLDRKKLKTPKIIKSIFKVGGVFAYKNMKRNKSKYRATVVALVVSITSFIAISYFMEIGFYTGGEMFKDTTYNVSVQISNTEDISSDELKSTYEEIVKLEKNSPYSIHSTKDMLISEKYFDENFTENTWDADVTATIVYMLSVGESEYERYLDEMNLDNDEVKGKGIVVLNSYNLYDEETGKPYEQKIIGEDFDKVEFFNKDNEGDIQLELIYLDKYPMGVENYVGAIIPVILVSEEVYEKIDSSGYCNGAYFNSADATKLQTKLEKFGEETGTSIYVHNIVEFIEQQNRITILVGIFFYGFITVITLIGLTNIFNTLTTNMMLRSREFGVLKSTGMTKKEFKNMIRLESIFYGVKSLFWGVLLGTGLSYLMYNTMAKLNFLLFDDFSPPYIAILIAVVFVFFVINLIMRYSLSKINKQNIIETIKNENI